MILDQRNKNKSSGHVMMMSSLCDPLLTASDMFCIKRFHSAGGPAVHYLVKTSSGVVELAPDRDDAFPNCSLRGCLPCSLTMTPSLTGSQSILGTSSWLGNRQHSSIRLSSGSWGGLSSRAEPLEPQQEHDHTDEQDTSDTSTEEGHFEMWIGRILTAEPQLGEQPEQQLHAVLVV